MILGISGCCDNEPKPCEPQPCKNILPHLTTWKVPDKKRFIEQPIPVGDGVHSIVRTDDLKGCLATNRRLRKICSNYAVVFKKINDMNNKENK